MSEAYLQNAEKDSYKTPKKILTKRRKRFLQNAEKNLYKTPKNSIYCMYEGIQEQNR